MYEAFFGLRERPFELTANPRYLFLTLRHREALSTMIYGLASRKGLTVLIGEAGTGKTTLLSAALAQWQAAGHLVVALRNPTLDRNEFQQFLAREFSLSPEAAASKSVLLHEIEALLRQRHEAGLLTALVLDEAHSMPIELLEEVRLLANIETADTKLLPLIMLGQPELADRLNEPALRQLKQRIALRGRLDPLDIRETAAYIAKRIRVAGGDSLRVFTREAVSAIFVGSGGIPRLINVICDNALVNGMAAGEQPVGQDTVREVCADFDLAVAPTPQMSGAPRSGLPVELAPAGTTPAAEAAPRRQVPRTQPAAAQALPAAQALVSRPATASSAEPRLLTSARTIPMDDATAAESVPPLPPSPPRHVTRGSRFLAFLRSPLALFRS